MRAIVIYVTVGQISDTIQKKFCISMGTWTLAFR